MSQKETLDFDLLFLGHLDVVPASPDSFVPTERDGKLYGRGAADMKSGCAAMIELFLSEGCSASFSNFGLLLTTDEEVGGFDGVGMLVQDHELRAGTLFNPDGPDVGCPFCPCIEEKGILHVRLQARGVEAHGAQPWLGKNAIDAVYMDVTRIRSGLPLASNQDTDAISLNLGRLQGGKAVNSVPAEASAHLDIRFPPSVELVDLKNTIKSLSTESSVEVLLEANPVSISSANPRLQTLMKTIVAHGFECRPVKEFGASDARWFTPQGTNVLMILPECSRFHVEDEWVSIKSLYKFYDVIREYALAHHEDSRREGQL